MRDFIIGAVMTVAVATSAVAGPINLIRNGSFETGVNDAAPGGFTMKYAGSTDLTGWVVTQNNIDWDSAFWQAADGTHSLDLNGNLGPGGLSQTISTIIGKNYTLSFAMAGNPNLCKEISVTACPDILMSLTAFAGPASADFNFNVLPSYDVANMHWTARTFDFTANSTTTQIRFASTTVLSGSEIYDGFFDCCYGPALDNVSLIEAVAAPAILPEPSTLAIFAFGLMAICRCLAQSRDASPDVGRIAKTGNFPQEGIGFDLAVGCDRQSLHCAD